MNVVQTGRRLREQMEPFLGNLPLPKPDRRFARETLYGILSRGSLKLSQIARSLAKPIALIKTENRLSRQAARPALADVVRDWVIAQAEPRVGCRSASDHRSVGRGQALRPENWSIWRGCATAARKKRPMVTGCAKCWRPIAPGTGPSCSSRCLRLEQRFLIRLRADRTLSGRRGGAAGADACAAMPAAVSRNGASPQRRRDRNGGDVGVRLSAGEAAGAHAGAESAGGSKGSVRSR